MALVTFDIDGTISKASVAHHHSFFSAFRKVYHIDADETTVATAGKTDMQIIRDVLSRLGYDKGSIDTKIFDCMDEMACVFKDYLRIEPLIELPGARQLIRSLYSKHTLGVISGNISGIGKEKLRSIGIWDYFDSEACAWGDQEPLKRGLIHEIKTKYPQKTIFYIADTPQDMEEAYRAGVFGVGVLTGGFSSEDLKHSNQVFESLADPEIITYLNKRPE